MVVFMNVKDIDQYYKRLSQNIVSLSIYLQHKAEYGTHVSERGIQQSVLYTVKKIAREYHLNEELVSIICQLVGLCFPTRGLSELAYIKEYIKKNHINVSLDTLEIDAIEYMLYESGDVVTKELDYLLRLYYFDDESIDEINLVRFIQRYLNNHRHLLSTCSFHNYGQIIDDIMNKAKEEYITSYRLIKDINRSSLLDDIKKEIENNIKETIEFEKDESIGIYKVII